MDRLIRGTPKSPCGCMNAGWTLPFAGIYVRTGKRLHVQNLTRLWVTLCLRREERKQSKTRRYIPKEPVKRSGLSKMSECVFGNFKKLLYSFFTTAHMMCIFLCVLIFVCAGCYRLSFSMTWWTVWIRKLKGQRWAQSVVVWLISIVLFLLKLWQQYVIT